MMFYRIRIRARTSVTLVALCAVAVAGCGSGSSRPSAPRATDSLLHPSAAISPDVPAKSVTGSEIVARVGHGTITRATVEHWMAVGTTKAEVPRPPAFTACVARSKKGTATTHGRSGANRQALKSSCERRYNNLKADALGLLIYAEWLFHEAGLLGLQVGDTEVRQAYEKNVESLFPTEAAFAESLAQTGRTPSDVLFSTKIGLTATKLREWLKHRPGAVTAAQKQVVFEEFVTAWHARWIDRTSCVRGYVVAYCKQYSGPRTAKRSDPYLL
jgi:hypothetical protein